MNDCCEACKNKVKSWFLDASKFDEFIVFVQEEVPRISHLDDVAKSKQFAIHPLSVSLTKHFAYRALLSSQQAKTKKQIKHRWHTSVLDCCLLALASKLTDDIEKFAGYFPFAAESKLTNFAFVRNNEKNT